MEDIAEVCGNMREIDAKGLRAVYGELTALEYAKRRYDSAEASLGLWRGEELVAVGGTHRWGKTVTLWLIATPEWEMSWREAYRAMKRVLPVLWEDGVLRLQAAVMDGFSEGCAMLEHLGFEEECRKRKSGLNGEDVIEYAMVKP